MPTSRFNPDSIPDLKGKVFLVTGGNNGIGKATVIGLANRGATVYMGARSEQKAIAAIQEINKDLPNADIHYLYLDLGNLASVVYAAQVIREKVTALHGLINNAGIMGVPYSITGDGYEIQFQTNYLSHWLLTYHLLPLLSSTATSFPPGTVRIVNVTSDGHAKFAPKSGIDFQNITLESSSSMTRYGQSKLANILHIKQLQKLYGPDLNSPNPQIWFAAVHPGHIDTALNKQSTDLAPAAILRPMTKSSLFAIASSDFERKDSGSYIVPYAKIGVPSENAMDERLTQRLWDWTSKEMEMRGLLS
ncbi:NAD(P)-binding protein [Zopfia rhizophila CBS 207.26]|uniref:NAD(P)-binding protein n=1 Tax=Zopfia rhizophila CBS 207.26 TaxID=1314779 RepID=A0A6A6EWI1_9PEZI|nr:NAD(P)-binding protein [Zopfia rhizophila CBS 207.26]